MADDSLFFSLVANAWTDDVSDPFLSSFSDNFSQQVRFGLSNRQIYNYAFQNGEIHSYSIPSTVGQYLFLRVIGEIRLEVFNGSGAAGIFPCYGTAILPGIIILTPTALTGIIIYGLQDDSAVQFLFATP